MLVVTRYGESLKRRFIAEIADAKELPDAPSAETGWMAMATRVARREKPIIKPFDFSPSVSSIERKAASHSWLTLLWLVDMLETQ